MTIAFYFWNDMETKQIKNYLQTYIKERNLSIQLKLIEGVDNLLKSEADIYIININLIKYNTDIIKKMENKNRGKTIYIADNPMDLINLLSDVQPYYYLLKDFQAEQLFNILDIFKETLPEERAVVKIPLGEYRIKIKDLNYVDISGRNLCYHLTNGKTVDSQCIRTSFAKEVGNLINNKHLHFIAPSLLINLSHIKTMYKDYLILDNDETVYFPRRAYEKLHTAWKEYYTI